MPTPSNPNSKVAQSGSQYSDHALAFGQGIIDASWTVLATVLYPLKTLEGIHQVFSDVTMIAAGFMLLNPEQRTECLHFVAAKDHFNAHIGSIEEYLVKLGTAEGATRTRMLTELSFTLLAGHVGSVGVKKLSRGFQTKFGDYPTSSAAALATTRGAAAETASKSSKLLTDGRGVKTRAGALSIEPTSKEKPLVKKPQKKSAPHPLEDPGHWGDPTLLTYAEVMKTSEQKIYYLVTDQRVVWSLLPFDKKSIRLVQTPDIPFWMKPLITKEIKTTPNGQKAQWVGELVVRGETNLGRQYPDLYPGPAGTTKMRIKFEDNILHAGEAIVQNGQLKIKNYDLFRLGIFPDPDARGLLRVLQKSTGGNLRLPFFLETEFGKPTQHYMHSLYQKFDQTLLKKRLNTYTEQLLARKSILPLISAVTAASTLTPRPASAESQRSASAPTRFYQMLQKIPGHQELLTDLLSQDHDLPGLEQHLYLHLQQQVEALEKATAKAKTVRALQPIDPTANAEANTEFNRMLGATMLMTLASQALAVVMDRDSAKESIKMINRAYSSAQAGLSVAMLMGNPVAGVIAAGINLFVSAMLDDDEQPGIDFEGLLNALGNRMINSTRDMLEEWGQFIHRAILLGNQQIREYQLTLHKDQLRQAFVQYDHLLQANAAGVGILHKDQLGHALGLSELRRFFSDGLKDLNKRLEAIESLLHSIGVEVNDIRDSALRLHNYEFYKKFFDDLAVIENRQTSVVRSLQDWKDDTDSIFRLLLDAKHVAATLSGLSKIVAKDTSVWALIYYKLLTEDQNNLFSATGFLGWLLPFLEKQFEQALASPSHAELNNIPLVLLIMDTWLALAAEKQPWLSIKAKKQQLEKMQQVVTSLENTVNVVARMQSHRGLFYSWISAALQTAENDYQKTLKTKEEEAQKTFWERASLSRNTSIASDLEQIRLIDKEDVPDTLPAGWKSVEEDALYTSYLNPSKWLKLEPINGYAFPMERPPYINYGNQLVPRLWGHKPFNYPFLPNEKTTCYLQNGDPCGITKDDLKQCVVEVEHLDYGLTEGLATHENLKYGVISIDKACEIANSPFNLYLTTAGTWAAYVDIRLCTALNQIKQGARPSLPLWSITELSRLPRLTTIIDSLKTKTVQAVETARENGIPFCLIRLEGTKRGAHPLLFFLNLREWIDNLNIVLKENKLSETDIQGWETLFALYKKGGVDFECSAMDHCGPHTGNECLGHIRIKLSVKDPELARYCDQNGIAKTMELQHLQVSFHFEKKDANDYSYFPKVYGETKGNEEMWLAVLTEFFPLRLSAEIRTRKRVHACPAIQKKLFDRMLQETPGGAISLPADCGTTVTDVEHLNKRWWYAHPHVTADGDVCTDHGPQIVYIERNFDQQQKVTVPGGQCYKRVKIPNVCTRLEPITRLSHLSRQGQGHYLMANMSGYTTKLADGEQLGDVYSQIRTVVWPFWPELELRTVGPTLLRGLSSGRIQLSTAGISSLNRILGLRSVFEEQQQTALTEFKKNVGKENPAIRSQYEKVELLRRVKVLFCNLFWKKEADCSSDTSESALLLAETESAVLHEVMNELSEKIHELTRNIEAIPRLKVKTRRLLSDAVIADAIRLNMQQVVAQKHVIEQWQGHLLHLLFSVRILQHYYTAQNTTSVDLYTIILNLQAMGAQLEDWSEQLPAHVAASFLDQATFQQLLDGHEDTARFDGASLSSFVIGSEAAKALWARAIDELRAFSKQINGNAEIDLPEILTLAHGAMQSLQNCSHQEQRPAMIFMGPTRVGKSAFSNAVSGVDYTIVLDGEDGEAHLVVEKGIEIVKTSASSKSETLYPQIFPVLSGEYHGVDMQGIGDSRGLSMQILLGLTARELTHCFSEVGALILVLNANDLAPTKIAVLKTTFSQLAKLVRQQPQVMPNVVVVVNRASPTDTPARVKMYLETFANDHRHQKKFPKEILFFLDSLNESHIVVADGPTPAIRDALLARVKTIQPVAMHSFDWNSFNTETATVDHIISGLRRYKLEIEQQQQLEAQKLAELSCKELQGAAEAFSRETVFSAAPGAPAASASIETAYQTMITELGVATNGSDTINDFPVSLSGHSPRGSLLQLLGIYRESKSVLTILQDRRDDLLQVMQNGTRFVSSFLSDPHQQCHFSSDPQTMVTNAQSKQKTLRTLAYLIIQSKVVTSYLAAIEKMLNPHTVTEIASAGGVHDGSMDISDAQWSLITAVAADEALGVTPRASEFEYSQQDHYEIVNDHHFANGFAEALHAFIEKMVQSIPSVPVAEGSELVYANAVALAAPTHRNRLYYNAAGSFIYAVDIANCTLEYELQSSLCRMPVSIFSAKWRTNLVRKRGDCSSLGIPSAYSTSLPLCDGFAFPLGERVMKSCKDGFESGAVNGFIRGSAIAGSKKIAECIELTTGGVQMLFHILLYLFYFLSRFMTHIFINDKTAAVALAISIQETIDYALISLGLSGAQALSHCAADCLDSKRWKKTAGAFHLFSQYGGLLLNARHVCEDPVAAATSMIVGPAVEEKVVKYFS